MGSIARRHLRADVYVAVVDPTHMMPFLIMLDSEGPKILILVGNVKTFGAVETIKPYVDKFARLFPATQGASQISP
jgi:hypothetical protein